MKKKLSRIAVVLGQLQKANVKTPYDAKRLENYDHALADLQNILQSK